MDRVGAQTFIEAHRGKFSDISCSPPFNDSDRRGVVVKGARRLRTPAGRRQE